MKKVILYSAVSLDMLIAGENDDLEWLIDSTDYGYDEFYQSIDITIMGRKTYDLVLTFGDFPYKDKVNYVFSDNNQTDNEDVKFITKDHLSNIQKILKGKGIVWLVGGSYVNTFFLENNLIDELQLFIHPVFLEKGIPLFQISKGLSNFEIVETKIFENNVVFMKLSKIS